jgi:hypothetical protein
MIQSDRAGSLILVVPNACTKKRTSPPVPTRRQANQSGGMYFKTTLLIGQLQPQTTTKQATSKRACRRIDCVVLALFIVTLPILRFDGADLEADG